MKNSDQGGDPLEPPRDDWATHAAYQIEQAEAVLVNEGYSLQPHERRFFQSVLRINRKFLASRRGGSQ